MTPEMDRDGLEVLDMQMELLKMHLPPTKGRKAGNRKVVLLCKKRRKGLVKTAAYWATVLQGREKGAQKKCEVCAMWMARDFAVATVP